MVLCLKKSHATCLVPYTNSKIPLLKRESIDNFDDFLLSNQSKEHWSYAYFVIVVGNMYTDLTIPDLVSIGISVKATC